MRAPAFLPGPRGRFARHLPRQCQPQVIRGPLGGAMAGESGEPPLAWHH